MKVGYFPGCSLEGSSRDFAESLHAVAKALSLELCEIPEWNCCGASSGHMIDHLLSIALPINVLLKAQQAGMDQVMAPCAACYNRLVEAYASGNVEGSVGLLRQWDPRVYPDVAKACDKGLDKNDPWDARRYAAAVMMHTDAAFQISRQAAGQTSFLHLDVATHAVVEAHDLADQLRDRDRPPRHRRQLGVAREGVHHLLHRLHVLDDRLAPLRHHRRHLLGAPLDVPRDALGGDLKNEIFAQFRQAAEEQFVLLGR